MSTHLAICSLEQKAARNTWRAHQSVKKQKLSKRRNGRLQAIYLERRTDILPIS